MNDEKWIVGPEHEESLFKRLGAALSQVDFEKKENWSGVAGSHEVSHWKVSSIRGRLLIEAETYIGLSVEGPGELVQEVRKQFEKMPC